MRINVDPNTDVSGFGYANAGRYTLRITKSEQMQGPKAPYIKWTLEFADPNVQSSTGKGKVGNIFENTTLSKENNGQFRLRQLCEACGITWGDFDTDDMIGREFDAEVDVKEYNGTLSNEVKKYVPAKS